MTTLVQVLTSEASIDKNLKMPTSMADQKPPSATKHHGNGDTMGIQSEITTSQMAQQDHENNDLYSKKNISQLSESIQRLDLLHTKNGGSDHVAAPQRISSRDSIGKDEWGNGESAFALEDDFSYNIPHNAAPESLHMTLNGGSSFNSVEESGRSEIAESVTTTSLSSRGSTPSNSLPRPLLYSAIGSLENPNAASLGSYAKRLSNAVNKSSLLPPASMVVATAIESVLNKQETSEASNISLKSGSSQGTSDCSNGAKSGSHRHGNDGQGGKLNLANGATGTTSVDSEGNAVNSLRNIVQAKSSLRSSQTSKKKKKDKKKKVSYDPNALKSKKQVEMFRPSCDAYTPRIEKKQIKYKAAENRTPVQTMATTMGTLQRPNFRDALRRVAMIIHQHIVKIERRFETNDARLGGRALFTSAMKEAFSEEKFCTPKYKCTMVRIPMARPGMVFGLRKIKTKYMIPSEKEIYEFAHQLFKSVQLSSECSIVCLIYVERLMEAAKVPLMACTWRPIFMCGLLLASKVWQDLSSWNIEFASVYPQFSLDAINKLEINFLRNIKWDLYISSSLYAKYYFALRSLVEKVDFRQRYNRMVGRVDSVAQAEALKIQERSEAVKEEALLQLSRNESDESTSLRPLRSVAYRPGFSMLDDCNLQPPTIFIQNIDTHSIHEQTTTQGSTKMPPLLTQVARISDGLPLVASQTPSPGIPVTNQHQKEAKDILRKITTGTPTKMSITSGDMIFYYMTRDSLCFLTMTEARYPKRLAFLYLDEVCDMILSELVKEFDNNWRAEVDKTGRPFAFIHYDPIVQRKQREFQDERQQRSKLNDDLSEIQSIMKKNINDLLDRGEKLDNVQNISQDLLKQSSGFKWGARKLTWQARLQQAAPILIGGSIVVFVIYVKFFW